MTDIKKAFQFSTLAVAIGLTSSAFAFDSLTVFGDSLSDTGNNGRWTWNSSQNKLYDEQLADRYGLTLTPSRTGGSNYAAGGGTAVPGLNLADNTQSQVQQYLSQTGGRADGNGLYIHWIGGNDLAAAATQPALAQGIAANSAANAAAQVGALLDAGAGLVVVPNVPDISATPTLMEMVLSVGLGAAATPAIQAAYASLDAAKTPDLASRQQAIHDALRAAASVVSANPLVQQAAAAQLIAAYDAAAQQASALTDFYNGAEDKALSQRGGNIARADINGVFQEILVNPQAFGLTNTAGMACPAGVSASDCTSSTPGFNPSQDYLFADHFHPSPQVHSIIAQYIESIIAAPVQVTRLNQGTLAMVRGSRATLDGRYQQLRHNDNAVGSLGVFGGYGGGYQRYSGEGKGNTNNLTVGVDYQLNDSLLVGGLIAGSLDNQRPDDNYRYDTRGVQAALFSQLRVGQAWINGDVHYLSADFTNIRRDITLGQLTRTEKGDTDGRLYGARLTAGYDFALTPWLTTGPTLQYAWDYSHVNGYGENGSSSTAMRFGDQNGHSQIGSAGWRVDAHPGVINPWAQASYRHQFGDREYSVNGGLKSTALTFSRTGEEQDKNWAELSVGADMPLSATVSAFAAVSQTAGLSDGNQTSYNLGISAKF
ncbi:autotransporter outer membrane beta-barrel domain-containing protein [Cedecea sp. FDAARGOS_727]|uniref:autotransporter outer membrane beta-barrel domain-containing protein n=1 Tax=Cedecea sp. FDAARGOS_727 TaxID=2545798 RepID=UPI00143EAC61|nr:autotransporter domain-containing protein [Cedecea sp. FDAARGOS_727]QIX97099.1 autotransporter domain-containing protein [Cedecea sp. FDAARGOS_727]